MNDEAMHVLSNDGMSMKTCLRRKYSLFMRLVKPNQKALPSN